MLIEKASSLIETYLKMGKLLTQIPLLNKKNYLPNANSISSIENSYTSLEGNPESCEKYIQKIQ